jgi:hypothetical protein
MPKDFDVRASTLRGSHPESGRVLSDADLRPDPALVAEGWERRFTADASRAAEAMELYAQLGYEVRAESVIHEEHTDECGDCSSVMALQFKTIYTRKKKS